MRRTIGRLAAISVFLVGFDRAEAAVWDTNFGDHGVSVFHLTATPSDLMQMPDGRFAFGAYTSPGTTGLVAITKADGTPDSGFGANGLMSLPGIRDVSSLGIDSEGRFLAAGNGGLNNAQLSIARFNASGQLDSTFGAGGIAHSTFGTLASPSKLAFGSAGSIIAAGVGPGMITQRLNASGQSIWTRQELVLPTSQPNLVSATDVLVQDDGKVVVAGRMWQGVNCCPQQSFGGFELFRYNSDGTPDTSFGSTGQVFTYIAPPTQSSITAFPSKMKLLSNGNYLLVGRGVGQTVLVEIKPDGTSGKMGRTIFEQAVFPSDLDVKEMSDGTIRVVGVSGQSIYEDIFDSAGQNLSAQKYDLPAPGINVPVNLLLMQRPVILDDGDILVTGKLYETSGRDSNDVFIGRIQGSLSAVPEPAGLMLISFAMGLGCTRVSARRHRRVHR